MADKNRLGLHLSFGGSATADDFQLAREAEDFATSSPRSPGSPDPTSHPVYAQVIFAVNTSKAELATGVIPMQIRTPGVNAMAFLTVHELSGGRAIAGLGVSSPVIVERWHGASYQKPVTAMRECVTIMRQLFTEGRSKFAGEVYHSDFRLGMRSTQKHPPKIYLAALNAPMPQTAGSCRIDAVP